MDFFKIAFFINAMTICLNVAVTYMVVADLFLNQPTAPFTIVSLAFGYGIMIKYNFVFHELWDKWFGDRK
ncbi:hypothetical protein [Lentibacillus cibarius]|uniref:Uncharacterized protein n=1 Tax=Lentibacillus cibarius TaxID=2583219 RepID=A0A5S3QKW5_9BACI|nr:hypothetical protein [Lentibacillus cibarius]TMN21851.1 hypothetical protein FFL34_06785 [Lentibacillus cibarius]